MVIIGGGIAGCSVAYHLAKLNVRDVVLLERGRLTSGTTWHAAGLVMQLRTSAALTELCRYSARLYEQLEAETGQATGFRRNGSLPIARTNERFTEIKRLASLGKVFGVETEILSPAEVKARYPLLDDSQIVGGMFVPGDGQTNPVDTTMALAKGARIGGARIFEGVAVTGISVEKGRVRSVQTETGSIVCETVVLCCGLWTRDLAAKIGVNVPLYAAEHMYVLTKGIPNIPTNLPVLRDTDGYVYVKEDAGNLLIGCFEPCAKPRPAAELPDRAEFIEFDEDWDHFELPISNAIEMIPQLATAEIRKFLNGPESFTPDNQFIVGPAPKVAGVYVAAGFNSQGVLAGAGIGKALAEWIVQGAPTLDLSEIDIARFQEFQANERYLNARTKESVGLLYAMHWPHRQMETARPARLSPLDHRLRAHNACFGETAGWERANWYAREGVAPEYQYSYGRQNWFDCAAAEHRAVREDVGLFDLSSFAKFELVGPDAAVELNRICANDVDVPPGKIVYTAMLNSRGGFEADLTVTRLAEDRFLIVTAATSQNRDFIWIKRNLRPDARAYLFDVTAGYAVLALMGPNARKVLSRVTDADLSNDAFPFATAQSIDVGYAKALAMRVSYVGELGWELFASTEVIGPIFDLLIGNGADLGLRLAGYHALDSLRLEKGYRHWGHDITPQDTPIEAGLAFAVAWNKRGGFTGCEALLRQKQQGPKRRLAHFLLADSQPLMFHNEPIWRDGNIVGRITSGGYGHALGRSVGMGYVEAEAPITPDFVERGRYEIEIACERFAASASRRPFYDPDSERMRV